MTGGDEAASPQQQLYLNPTDTAELLFVVRLSLQRGRAAARGDTTGRLLNGRKGAINKGCNRGSKP